MSEYRGHEAGALPDRGRGGRRVTNTAALIPLLAYAVLIAGCGQVLANDDSTRGADAGIPCQLGACCASTGVVAPATTVCASSVEYRCGGNACGGLAQKRTIE